MTTYEDAAKSNLIISRKRAMIECRKHNVPFQELLNDLGDKDEYTAREELAWLGY